MGGEVPGATEKRDLSIPDGFVRAPDPWPMTGSGEVAVVVPLVSADLTADEELSVASLRHHAAGIPAYLVVPDDLVLRFDHAGFAVVRVPRAAMASIAAYNRMMLTPWFYRLFAGYRHILLYQLDCLMLRDDLAVWCELDWSYIGAPWFGKRAPDDLKSVGNGGFSLRRIDHMLAVLESDRFSPWLRVAQQWRHFSSFKHLKLLAGGLMKARKTRDGSPLAQRFAGCFQRPEDEFWSQYAPFFLDRYRLPTPRLALGFAFEARPRTAFEMTGGSLPFGCHAWSRMDRQFWLERIAGMEEQGEALKVEAPEREAALSR
jgi:hypothetical protein